MKFFEFLKSKKEIKLGFLGGSITYGSGASTPSACYREKVTRALNEKYSDVTFSDINAAIGGTGSDFGLFRMQRQLLSNNPDMVFVEFAVNDSCFPKTDLYVENIIRLILEKDPKTPIVLVFTVSGSMINEGYSQGKLPKSVELQKAIAEYYNIPTVNVGKALYDKIVAEGADIKEYAPDTVHPNDKGYEVYADCIMSVLCDMEFEIVPHEKLATRKIKDPSLVFPCEKEGWKLSEALSFNLGTPYVSSDDVGASYSFTFNGSVIGAVFHMEKDSGDFDYIIDGQKRGHVSCYDSYCDSFSRVAYKLLEEELENCEHTLEIVVSDQKNENSTGNVIRLCAFMTAQ